MTFSPRPRLFARFAGLGLVVIALGALASSGCEDKHIGRKCDLDVPDGGVATGNLLATINSAAVECPTRICLLAAANKPTNTGSLCSADCSSDDDCGGETTTNSNDTHCKSGFACLVPTTVGDFCCRRLCVCKDFVDTLQSDYHATPDACKPGNGLSSCPSVH
jgi:hypothetical protein